MFNAFSSHLSSKKTWWLIVPTAFLISAIACIGLASSWLIYNTSYLHFKTSGVEVKIEARIDNVQNQIKLQSDFLQQQQTTLQDTTKQLERFSKIIAKPEMHKFTTTTNLTTYHEILQTNLSQITPDLTNTISSLKNQTAQIDAQKKNLKALNDELTQLKNELRKNSGANQSQSNKK